MTRATLSRKMKAITLSLIAVLAVALAAKLAEIGAIALPGSDSKDLGKAIYEFLKDMAVVIVTIAAVYVAAILQRRSSFIESLEKEWRRMVKMKSKLFTYCEQERPTYDTYLAAFCSISEVLDSMRLVYKNVGETDELIGLYAFSPLHDMRRAFRTLDPSKKAEFSDAERKLVRDAIIQCFYALRENFLEELDLEAPQHPLLAYASARAKRSGMTRAAEVALKRHRKEQDSLKRSRPDIDTFLREQWLAEENRQSSSAS